MTYMSQNEVRDLGYPHQNKTSDGWIRVHKHGWCGPESVIAALTEVWDDSSVNEAVWVVADHPTVGHTVHKVVGVGIGDIEGEARWRYHGEGRSPNGAGSHTVCHEFDLVNPVAMLAMALGRTVGEHPNSTIYRQLSRAPGCYCGSNCKTCDFCNGYRVHAMPDLKNPRMVEDFASCQGLSARALSHMSELEIASLPE